MYKKRLIEIKDSKVELKKLIGEFPITLLLLLDSHRAGRERKVINQKMKSLNEKISQLVINLKAKGPVKDASKIKHVKFMGRLAQKEYLEHKLIMYETCAGYLEKEVL